MSCPVDNKWIVRFSRGAECYIGCNDKLSSRSAKPDQVKKNSDPIYIKSERQAPISHWKKSLYFATHQQPSQIERQGMALYGLLQIWRRLQRAFEKGTFIF